MESIMVICAHNDDQIIGAGGTIAKYAKEGRKVITVIFSYGELSHPHLKPEVITKKRVEESQKSDKILGGSGVVYLGIKEPEFMDSVKEYGKREKIKETLNKLIEENKPEKIFTHSNDDPHGLHRKVHELVMEIIKEAKIKAEVYSFDIWNPIKIRGRNKPKMVVDITDTFSAKIRAFKAHKSQKMTIFTLLWNVYLRAIMNGWQNSCRYAEIFYKLN